MKIVTWLFALTLLLGLIFLFVRQQSVTGIGSSEAELANAMSLARLLVAEIKLYETYKVERGLKNANLYESLRDEIEKARIKFNRQFNKAYQQACFDDALIDILADGDKYKLGSDFNSKLA